VALTKYIVLFGDGSAWRKVGERAAYSSKAAVQGYCVDNEVSKDGGEYVAVPVRSWRPVQVAIEIEEHVRVTPGQLTFADAEG
jgi:hypothetical protein